jgi:hypothetical protein
MKVEEEAQFGRRWRSASYFLLLRGELGVDDVSNFGWAVPPVAPGP